MVRKEGAMIELTDDQRQELQQAEPTVIDPATNETYVLVRKETYDRMKALVAEDEEDRKTQGAFLKASHQAAVSWMKDNPY
jgi:hypothetical protein